MEGTDRSLTTWRKSTYSSGNGSNCVEVGETERAVLVRDTKDRAGVVLTFGAGDTISEAGMKVLPYGDDERFFSYMPLAHIFE